MPSINDVAKKAGVSTATVSRTFSAPGLINEQTQKRVLEAARQLNYQPRRLRLARSSVNSAATQRDAIGFQFFAAAPSDSLLSNSFYAPVLAGAQAEASALGMHLLLHTTDRHQFSQELPKMIHEQAVGGMLLVGTTDPAILAAFAAHVPKIILVDNRDETGMYESVISDGFGGACAATRYLLEIGHRRIGFLLGEPGVPTFQDRLRGYLCALWEAGLTPEPSSIVQGDSEERLQESLGLLLKSLSPPTALVAANDYYALLAMRTCREQDIKIPGDISLVGFDDTSFSPHADPPLTTVRVDKEFMGRLAVRRLHARLHAESSLALAEPRLCNQIPVSLILRQSCRAV